VLVLVTGRPYDLSFLSENAGAVLEAWLPGEEGGAAVADILFGNQNPGGKLPVTFPRSAGQIPIYYNAKPSGTKSHWYVDYVTEKVTPLYPFGHGLSYTSFEYGDLSIDKAQVKPGEHLDISFTVKNVGGVVGEETVQLYTHDEIASISRPVKELRAYRRLMLAPDEKKKVTFHLPVDQLAFFDLDLKLVVEAGPIEVMVGSSSADIRLSGEFTITADKQLPIMERVFFCPVEVS